MVVLRYVFTLLKALNDLSLVALLAGITRTSFITVITSEYMLRAGLLSVCKYSRMSEKDG